MASRIDSPSRMVAVTPITSPRLHPNRHPTLDWWAKSRCGSYHSINQDAWWVALYPWFGAVTTATGGAAAGAPPADDSRRNSRWRFWASWTERRFFGVADGVGGGAFGEVASRAALRYCAALGGRDASNPDALIWHVQHADAVVRDTLAAVNGAVGATTLVVAWLVGWRGWIVHVGDARASVLRFNSGQFTYDALTEDQTYQALGELPPAGAGEHDPARMIGVNAVGEPPATLLRMEQGDILLLSSDGLHRYATATDISTTAQLWHQEHIPLRILAERLESLALGAGSPDDITMVLVRRPPRRPIGAWVRLTLVLLLAMLGAWSAWEDPPIPHQTIAVAPVPEVYCPPRLYPPFPLKSLYILQQDCPTAWIVKPTPKPMPQDRYSPLESPYPHSTALTVPAAPPVHD